MKRFTILMFVFAVLVPSAALGKTRVVATIPDLAAIAKAVGDDRVEVTTLAPRNVDPHHVDPRPNLILALNKADLLVINGLGVEAAWLDPLLAQARNPAITAGDGHLVAAEYAKLIEVPTKVDRSEGDIHPGGNPHFYQDPTSAIGIALAVRDRLSKLDPAGAETYAANAKAFTSALWKVAQAEAQRFARLPEAKRRVVSYHKSLGYLFRWLQLEEVATIEPKPGIPPNPKHVASVLQTMRSTGADVIIQEEYYPTKTSETLATMAKATVVVIPGGTDVDAGQTYIERVQETARRLYETVSK